MARSDRRKAGSDSRGSLGISVVVAVLVLCAFQVWWALDTRRHLDELEGLAARLEKAALEVGSVDHRLEALERKLAAHSNRWTIRSELSAVNKRPGKRSFMNLRRPIPRLRSPAPVCICSSDGRVSSTRPPTSIAA